jgi:hypothetical protein
VDHIDEWGVIIKKPKDKALDVLHTKKFWNKWLFRKLMGSRTLKESWSISKDLLISKYDPKHKYSYLELGEDRIAFGTEKFLKEVKTIEGLMHG